MDYKYIEQLLDRYFAAETTLQEEQILRAFFTGNTAEMPQELAKYASLFNAMSQEETLGDDFDERMMAMVGEEAHIVVKARTISLVERLRPLFGAAAVVAILLTLGNAINQSFKDSTKVHQPVVAEDYNPAQTGEPAVAYGQQGTDSIAVVSDRALVTDSISLVRMD